jgi:hypothetical protein
MEITREGTQNLTDGQRGCRLNAFALFYDIDTDLN